MKRQSVKKLNNYRQDRAKVAKKVANSDLNANYHMYIFADNDSSFYLNGWGFDAKSKADAAYVLSKLYTEQ